jgi:hypothetical protein
MTQIPMIAVLNFDERKLLFQVVLLLVILLSTGGAFYLLFKAWHSNNLFEQGNACYWQKDYAGAASAWRSALREQPIKDSKFFLNEIETAHNLMAIGRFADAESLYSEALQKVSGFEKKDRAQRASLLNYLALAYRNESKFDRAEAALLKSEREFEILRLQNEEAAVACPSHLRRGRNRE